MSRIYISSDKPLRPKIIPVMDVYDIPHLTDEESARYRELKKIVKNIKAHENSTNPEITGNIENFYRTQLNPMQCEAVFQLVGAILVIAGAGSGKTRTIVHRVAYMLQKGIDPQSILLLTFTRRASGEMIKRVNELTNAETADKITAGTFHSFANMMLRRFGRYAGIEPGFTICDTVDSADIIDLIKNDLDIKKRSRPFPKKATVFEIISRCRNHNRPIGEILDSQYPKYLEFAEDIVKIAAKYSEYKKAKNVLDYDDLLERFLELLITNHEVRERIQSKYRFVMVDEYQDTNTFQGQIADIIAKEHGNILVVGDDLQSIYAFRGANFENILRFPQNWPQCRVIKLEQNYRSIRELLDFTNNIVENCYAAYNKVLFSEMSGAVKPLVKRAIDAESEAVFVAEKIEEALKNIEPDEIAVLYRSGFHGNFIQAELLKRGMDFAVYGGIKFIERRHVKDVLSYAKMIENPKDAVALNRILKLIPGIGSGTAARIVESVVENGFIEAETHKKKKYYEEIKKLFSLISSITEEKPDVLKTVRIITDFYAPILKTIESDFEERLRDIDVLIQIAKNYRSLEKFLTDFALDPPSTQINMLATPVDAAQISKKIILSTVHSAKGLEWNTVFVVHLLDGCFPSERSMKRIDDLEEERRLFYVACSRAKENLYLTFPNSLSFYGGNLNLPSRFIAEIDEKFYEILR